VEFCVANHANMRIKAVAESQAEFDAWVKAQQAPLYEPQTPQEQAGQDYIVNQICANCHSLGDHHARKDEVGPNLTHLFSRSVFAGATYDLDETNLRRWLQNTQAMKPGNDMIVNLSSEDIDNLMAYLTKLK
jgi:cytochrome c oxidase subunit 2